VGRWVLAPAFAAKYHSNNQAWLLIRLCVSDGS